MRDHQHIQPFCPEINNIDRQSAIYAGSAREMALQRAKADKAQNPNGPSTNTMLQSVLNPLLTSTSGRGAHRDQTRGSRRGTRGSGRGSAVAGSTLSLPT